MAIFAILNYTKSVHKSGDIIYKISDFAKVLGELKKQSEDPGTICDSCESLLCNDTLFILTQTVQTCVPHFIS